MVSPFQRELPFDCHPSETREEDVRDGPDVLLVEDPLRRQRRLQLEPVWPSPGQGEKSNEQVCKEIWKRILIFSPQYDRAALTIMVQTQAASKEERFINDFFVNDEL